MISGNASAAFIPNYPSSDAKSLSLFLIHSFQTFLIFRRGSPPPYAVAAPPLPGNNASTSTPMAILIAVSMEAIVIPCSLNRVLIFSPNEVSLSNTLAIVSLKLVIWDFSFPFRRSMDSCLTFSSSFKASICFIMSSLIASSYSPGYFRNSSSFFSDVFFQLNLFATSTFREPRMVLSCLSRL